MPVYAVQSKTHEAYLRGSICSAVSHGCVKGSIGLPRYVRESFIVFVASQNSNPSLHRKLSLVSPAGP